MPHLYNFFLHGPKDSREKKNSEERISLWKEKRMLFTYLTRQCRMAVYLSFELCVKFLCYNIPKLNKEESESIGGSLTKAEVLKIRNN